MTSIDDVDAFRKSAAQYFASLGELVTAINSGDELIEASSEENEAREQARHEKFQIWRHQQSEMVRFAHLLRAAPLVLQAISDHDDCVREFWIKSCRLSYRESDDEPICEREDFSPRKVLWLDFMTDSRLSERRLQLLAGLGSPIETREFSPWMHVADLIVDADISEGTWRNRRREFPNDVQDHPKTGKKKVRITKTMAEVLGMSFESLGGD